VATKATTPTHETSARSQGLRASIELARAWMTPSVDSCAHCAQSDVAVREEVSLRENAMRSLDGDEILAGRGVNITTGHGCRAQFCGGGGDLSLRLVTPGNRDFIDRAAFRRAPARPS
jgi:hypothetical protein